MVSNVTQCSQFFHSVPLHNLKTDSTYYYQIPGGNGTASSDILSFKTAKAPGERGPFTVAVINDMGYTNAQGTHHQLKMEVDQGSFAFAWHGGDISYADDWYDGIIPCDLSGPQQWPVCWNGTSSSLPGPAAIPAEYQQDLPPGEFPNQGGPEGGDMNVIYESNWDLWQNWMSTAISSKIPYMVTPGNHEASCAEFDGPNNELSAYLDDGVPNSTLHNSTLNYYSCPASQRNFTAYRHRFSTPGTQTGGVDNFWYSFDYGLAHFISFSGETDYYLSPENPFVADVTANETRPTQQETSSTDSGPFGYIDGSYKNNENYEQWQWMERDLSNVDRSKTPWVFAMSHRPMYSSGAADDNYMENMRNAWEEMLIRYRVDAYIAGHIHWYERMVPLAQNSTIVPSSVIDNHTYLTDSGKSLVHITNGQAGNIESHSILNPGQSPLNITAALDYTHYGFSKLTVVNETACQWQFVHWRSTLAD